MFSNGSKYWIKLFIFIPKNSLVSGGLSNIDIKIGIVPNPIISRNAPIIRVIYKNIKEYLNFEDRIFFNFLKNLKDSIIFFYLFFVKYKYLNFSFN